MQWMKWKLRGGGNCSLGVGPLFLVVGAAAAVTVSPHGQSFLLSRSPTVLQFGLGSITLTGI